VILWTPTGAKRIAERIGSPRAVALVLMLDAFELPKEAFTLRRFSSHMGRHTAISQLLRDGEKLDVVSAMAGHARSSITEDHYTTIYDDERRAVKNSLIERRTRKLQAVF
jgi:integrase